MHVLPALLRCIATLALWLPLCLCQDQAWGHAHGLASSRLDGSGGGVALHKLPPSAVLLSQERLQRRRRSLSVTAPTVVTISTTKCMYATGDCYLNPLHLATQGFPPPKSSEQKLLSRVSAIGYRCSQYADPSPCNNDLDCVWSADISQSGVINSRCLPLDLYRLMDIDIYNTFQCPGSLMRQLSTCSSGMATAAACNSLNSTCAWRDTGSLVGAAKSTIYVCVPKSMTTQQAQQYISTLGTTGAVYDKSWFGSCGSQDEAYKFATSCLYTNPADCNTDAACSWYGASNATTTLVLGCQLTFAGAVEALAGKNDFSAAIVAAEAACSVASASSSDCIAVGGAAQLVDAAVVNKYAKATSVDQLGAAGALRVLHPLQLVAMVVATLCLLSLLGAPQQ